jgi:hypothetical protein
MRRWGSRGSIGMDDGPVRAYSIAMVPLRRRVIALAAAYAVALQGLLAAFAPAAVAWPDTSLLCSQQIAVEPAKSDGHDERLCAAACVMHGAAAAASPPEIVAARFAVPTAAEQVPSSIRLGPLWRSAQTARAPPSI